MAKITRPASQCSMLRSLEARLQQQLTAAEVWLTRLTNQHAPASEIQQWETTVRELSSEISFVQQEIRLGCAPPPPPPPPVPAPASGLGSNSNYIFYSDCDNLLNVSITIDVTQDIVCQSASGATSGFGFQLNAYSPKNQLVGWQQYVVALFSSQLIGAVDNWPLSGPNLINDFFNLAAMPSAKLPAGYKIQIVLGNDQNGNVTNATYVVTDQSGNQKVNVSLPLLSISGVTAADLAPIIAFELNLVGPVNGESAVLYSGAGTITYAATTALTTLNTEPACAESGYITAETANSFYGVLPAGPSISIIQTFNITSAAPMIHKFGKVRPSSPRYITGLRTALDPDVIPAESPKKKKAKR